MREVEHGSLYFQRPEGWAQLQLWLGNVYPTQYIKIECKESEVNIFVTCTYHSLHVCNRQALLCARLAAHCVNNIIVVVILYVNNILVVVILYACKQYIFLLLYFM